jgi:hypothetical protein
LLLFFAGRKLLNQEPEFGHLYGVEENESPRRDMCTHREMHPMRRRCIRPESDVIHPEIPAFSESRSCPGITLLGTGL